MTVTEKMIEAWLKQYSEGGCSGLADYERREVVQAILEAALAAAEPSEPVDYEQQSYVCPCIHPSQCDNSCFTTRTPSPADRGAVERAAKAMAARGYCRMNGINPEQEKVIGTDHFERWYASDKAQHRAYLDDAGAAIAALALPAAEVWQTMDSAPKGVPTENVGCRGESEWFVGRVAKEYRKYHPPFIVIRRRPWPQDDNWQCAGDAYYLPDFFDAWQPLSALAAPSQAREGGGK